MNRLAALQDWPVLSSRAPTAASTASSRSSVAEQDERVGAAELEHDLLQVAPGDLGDRRAGPLGAGQRDAPHARVGDDLGDLVVRGEDRLVGAVREARVVVDLLDRRGRLRALRRVLEQDRVADDQVRAGETGHLVVGEVPGHDPEQRTHRGPADQRACRRRRAARSARRRGTPRRCRRSSRRCRRRSRPRRGPARSACPSPGRRSRRSASRRSMWRSATRWISAARSATEVDCDHVRCASSALPIAASSSCVADVRVLLDLLAGGRVDDCVVAHLCSPRWDAIPGVSSE